MVLMIAPPAEAQFVAIPDTGSGGRTSGTSRRPTILPNGDVFIVNAWDGAEVYKASSRVFEGAGVSPVHLLDGVAALGLSDGRVVITGGGNSNADVHNFVLVWNPQTRSFRQITGMLSGRRGHAMIQLDSDRVLIVGGEGSPDTWEIYDIRQEKPTTSGTLPTTLYTVVAMEHPSGKIVFLSGTHASVFDRSTLTFASAYGLPETYAAGSPSTEMLSDGRILATGGTAPTGPTLRGTTGGILFDPLTGQHETVGPMLNPRFGHAATRLPSGKVLITGGTDDCVGWCKPERAPAEIFEPSTKSFSSTGSLNYPRLYHVPVRLRSGDVLLIGGDNGTDYPPGPELYVAEGTGVSRHRSVRH